MSKLLFIVVACIATCAWAQSTAPQYGQCAGQGWTGATTCPSGWSCQYSNPYYSQCLPGGSSSTSTTTSKSSTSTTKSTTTSTTTTRTSTVTGTTTTTASGGSATLQPGYSFIRAVEDPNFHQYLQSLVLNTASTAILGSPSTAGQFQITNGQLIQNALGTPLYAVVQPPATANATKLGVTWSTTPATSGTFVFSGDTVEWSSPTITRPQNNAWLVCPDAAGNRLLYINLGAYDYMTPAGCADETIHAYTGATATA